MLHHDQGVAQVPEPGEGLDQAAVVALVQADGRLVQDVQHAHQAGADLGGQPDALRLAAGQGGGRALQVQVLQADVQQEGQPGLDLLEHLVGDLGFTAGQDQVVQEVRRIRAWAARRPSAMDLPLISTDSDAGFSRAPLQAGQGICRMYSS